MKPQKMEVFGEFKPDDVLPYIGDWKKTYLDRRGNEWLVNMGSLRYATFARSLVCVICGVQGSVMRLERDVGKDCPPHFNLYAVVDNNHVLMTKDHIRPRAKGGKDCLDNMQTMCYICNGLKRDRELPVEHLLLIRRFYDMFIDTLNLRQITRVIQCVFDINATGGVTALRSLLDSQGCDPSSSSSNS